MFALWKISPCRSWTLPSRTESRTVDYSSRFARTRRKKKRDGKWKREERSVLSIIDYMLKSKKPVKYRTSDCAGPSISLFLSSARISEARERVHVSYTKSSRTSPAHTYGRGDLITRADNCNWINTMALYVLRYSAAEQRAHAYILPLLSPSAARARFVCGRARARMHICIRPRAWCRQNEGQHEIKSSVTPRNKSRGSLRNPCKGRARASEMERERERRRLRVDEIFMRVSRVATAAATSRFSCLDPWLAVYTRACCSRLSFLLSFLLAGFLSFLTRRRHHAHARAYDRAN